MKIADPNDGVSLFEVKDPMMHVCLETADGEHVQSARIPRFKEMPPVVIWGNRVFAHHELFIYREVFAYTVPE